MNDQNEMKLQAVINTLALLEMPMTYNNANHMTGIYNTLVQVRDDLRRQRLEAEEAQAALQIAGTEEAGPAAPAPFPDEPAAAAASPEETNNA